MINERPQEVWKTVRIEGESMPYEVSNLGRVRSMNKAHKGKILKNGEGRANPEPKFRIVWITHPNRNRQLRPRVDKLVATAFLGDPEPGDRLIHLNGCEWDDRAENLLWESTDLPSSMHTPLHPQETVARLADAASYAWIRVAEARKALDDALDDALKAERAVLRAEILEEGQKAVRDDGEAS
jgi:hypothetical protein